MKIEEKFTQLKKKQKKAFIVYIPFGYPNINYTKDILFSLQDTNIDLIELGVPFSDPLADGPIIQKATNIALKKGATIKLLFETLEEIKNSKIPILIMTYYNPLFRFGMHNFFQKMKLLNISGIMVVDLPFEESREYITEARKFNLETVFFITPTTSFQRAKNIVKASRGFIYYISVTGITGPKSLNYRPIMNHIKILKKITQLPICVGFGIHTPKQVKEVNKFSDGVIVGSSIVKFIENNFYRKDFLKRLKRYIEWLRDDKSNV
jgi:tryptophan synthase alpha chain